MWKLLLKYYKLDDKKVLSTKSIDNLQNHLIAGNVRIASEPKNNTMELELNNPVVDFFIDGTPRREFVDSTRNNTFKASKVEAGFVNFEERAELYAKWVTDITESVDSEDNLIFAGQIFQVKTKHNNKKCTMKLTCSDRTFNLLNRIYSNNVASQTVPQIIQTVVQQGCELDNATLLYNTSGVRGTGAGFRYPIDARLFSDGVKGGTDAITSISGRTITCSTATFVTDSVAEGDLIKNTSNNQVAIVREVIGETQIVVSKDIFTTGDDIQVSNGFIQDWRPNGTAFPTISYGKKRKPIIEWLDELRQIEYTNRASELSSTPVVSRPLRYYVDALNRLHVFYPDNNPSHHSRVGQSGPIGQDPKEYRIYSTDLQQGVFDIINFIIFNAGDDMNGVGVLWYYQDTSLGGPIVKDSYRPYVTIAEDLKRVAATELEIVRGTNGFYDYPTSYDPLPTGNSYPVWDTIKDTIPLDNDDYNDLFIREAEKIGQQRAQAEINLTANPRWKGKAEYRFYNFKPSDLMKLTDWDVGVNQQLLRIEDVQHNFSKNGFFTTLTLKQDNEELK